MISLRDNYTELASSIPAQVQAFFQAGGGLQQVAVNEEFPFEVRPQQIDMAMAVAEAILAPAHLAVEAGTGVGKTFAYLAPLILLARAREMPVAVSTQTINLQEQILSKDIPFLRRSLGVEFEVALCKGRQNYLCLRRLARARQMSGDLFHKAQERELDRIRLWSDTTEDGTLADWGRGGGATAPQGPGAENHQLSAINQQPLTINHSSSPLPSSDVWGQVCSEHDNCLGRQCPHEDRCFLMRARRQAFDADLLILNHHLFFSDLALRQDVLSAEGGAGPGGAGFLPEFKTIVFDEAHCLEDVAGEHLGLRLSQAGIERWLRRLYVPESGKGLLTALKESELTHAVGGLWDNTEDFFLEIKNWAKLEGKTSRRVVGAPLELSQSLSARLAATVQQVEGRLQNLENPDVQSELKSIIRRGLAIRDSLEVFLNQSQSNHVYWIESEGAHRKHLALYSAPIEVSPILEDVLFKRFSSVILTSATLAVGGGSEVRDQGSETRTHRAEGVEKRTRRSNSTSAIDSKTNNENPTTKNEDRTTKNSFLSPPSPLEYFRKRVGALDCRELLLGSPFDYSRQMRLYVAGDMPEPADDKAFGAAAVGAIDYFVRKSRGRAFVLFTSAEMMKTMARSLEPIFEAQGIMLLVQGTGLSRHVMLDHFRRVNGQAPPPAPCESPEGASFQSAILNHQSAIINSAVLFGLASFWMGVDVRGEALSNVIIVRLPFAVPDEPLTRARADRIRQQGGDPFRDYSLPEAILRFRQGVGRLIRTATDEGIIAILDSRIIGKWYGRYFLNAIPECPMEVVRACGGDDGRVDLE